jgi:hypothetical protein
MFQTLAIRQHYILVSPKQSQLPVGISLSLRTITAMVHLNLVVMLWWQVLPEHPVMLTKWWQGVEVQRDVNPTDIQAVTSRSNSRALMRCRLMVARISQTSLMQMHSFPRSMMLQPDM